MNMRLQYWGLLGFRTPHGAFNTPTVQQGERSPAFPLCSQPVAACPTNNPQGDERPLAMGP